MGAVLETESLAEIRFGIDSYCLVSLFYIKHSNQRRVWLKLAFFMTV